MSALPVDQHTEDVEDHRESVVAATPVEVRRNTSLSALVGAGSSAVAIAYLWRASQSGAVLDWLLFGVMALVAMFYLNGLLDSRTPLLVADDLGVRIRLGDEWRGLPWEAIDRVAVQPRRGPLRDGRIALAPRNLPRALDGLDVKGRRHAALNRRLYGAALAVPLGMTTRVSTHGELTVAQEIAALALGRAEVVALQPEDPSAGPRTVEPAGAPAQPAEPASAADASPAADDAAAEVASPVETASPVEPASPVVSGEATRGVLPSAPRPADEGAPGVVPTDPGPGHAAVPVRRHPLGGIGTIVSRVAKRRSGAASEPATTRGAGPTPDRPAADAPAAGGESADASTAVADPGRHDTDLSGTPAGGPGPVAVPLRSTRAGLRAEVTREIPAGRAATAEAEPAAPVGRELHRPGSVDLVIEPAGNVRPISQLGDPVEPLVVDDYVTEPAYDPVIGPELAAARTRLGLSVDELAERTRIRPHVIESIEVDDFAPCGGDFYARGHLRTLARVLGKDVAPLLAQFEERYATAPINARRVFEAELATGMTGSMRSTVGGPNWGLLVGVVLVLALVWGVVRLFSTEPPALVQDAPTLASKPATGQNAYLQPYGAVAQPVRVTLDAAHAGSRVVVRDADGDAVFRGTLALGEQKHLRAVPPVTVRAAEGGAVEVVVAGRHRGTLGQPGGPARRTFPASGHR